MSEHKPKTTPGQTVVDNWRCFIASYVACTDAQALTLALWALLSYVYETFYCVPYLEIWATEKRTGKSTLGAILANLVRGGEICTSIRTISMAKNIEGENGQYVPFFEEAEEFNKGALGETRRMLAKGYQRDGVHSINVNGERESFRTFSLKAFILIGNVHHVIRDRCISIRLRRERSVKRWSSDKVTGVADAEIATLREEWLQLIARAKADMDILSVTDDGKIRMHLVEPDWLASDRDRELWMPLFTLARALQLDKPTMALLHRASKDLSYIKSLKPFVYHPSQEESKDADGNATEDVIADALKVAKTGETSIPTETLLKRLHDLDDGPWRVWQGDGLSAKGLAALLKRYGVESKNGQIGKGREARQKIRGYRVADLKTAQAEIIKARKALAELEESE